VTIQILIVITGALAIWLAQDQYERRRRWASVFGLAGQPLWIYTTIDSGQWGMALLSVIYTLAWMRGCYEFWLRPWWRRWRASR